VQGYGHWFQNMSLFLNCYKQTKRNGLLKMASCNKHHVKGKKDKAIPVTGRGGP
jgi:hypothetical protein